VQWGPAAKGSNALQYAHAAHTHRLVLGLPAGVAAVGAEVTDIGVVTTPELHFTVQTYNQYHAVEEQAYFTNLLESFR
jgi:hypothetical protein